MFRLALVLLIISGGFAMAKDGNFQMPRNGAPIDQDEEFFKTEQGRDIERLFNDFTSGKKSYDDAYDEYQKKWGDKVTDKSPAQVPNAPRPSLLMGK